MNVAACDDGRKSDYVPTHLLLFTRLQHSPRTPNTHTLLHRKMRSKF